MVAACYEPLGHVAGRDNDQDNGHDGTRQDDAMFTCPSHLHADCASPSSTTTSATMASPSSSTYVTLADQTFTPLSMDSSDCYLSDSGHHDGSYREMDVNSDWVGVTRGNSASDAEHQDRALGPKRALLRRTDGFGKNWFEDSKRRSAGAGSAACGSGGAGAAGGSGGAGGAAGSGSGGLAWVQRSDGQAQAQAQAQGRAPPLAMQGATIVSAMVQSFEALQPATAPVGYDLTSTKNPRQQRGHGKATHHRLGLVSPPSTVSPSLSPPPPLSPSPAVEHEALQKRFSRVLNTNSTSRDIVVTASYPTPPAPPSQNPAHARQGSKQENSESPPLSQRGPAPQDTTHSQQDCRPPSTLSNPQVVDAKAAHALPALSIPPHTSAVTDFALSSTSTGTTSIARPTAQRPAPNHTPRTASPSPTNALFRTSSTASIPITHPTPDIGKRSRSGAYLGNIATLEASAERLSTSSSIDVAIREELAELKRSDSRRSSILQANSERRASGSDNASVSGQTQSSVASRQNSILGTNNLARLGGYSPGGFIMSPNSSLSGAASRLRSASKASSFNVPSPIAGNSRLSFDNGGGEDGLFMARHGPGKSSVRSTASHASLGLIAELDQPTGLTKEAFEEADRVAAIGEDVEDDDTIRASAHQHIDPEFADVLDDPSSPQTEVLLPVLDNGFADFPSPRLQLHQPDEYPPYGGHLAVQEYDRPTTSGSNMTFEAQRAFGDFDGVHCDPDAAATDFAPPPAPRFEETEFPPQPRRQVDQPPPRPKSYFDSSTGQQMLFYPAPVPAMLNLPPKLSKRPKAETAARNIRRSQILSAMPQAMPPQARESRVWLPDPLQDHQTQDNQPFMTGLLDQDLGPTSLGPDSAPQLLDPAPADSARGESSHLRQPSETSTIHAQQQPPQREIRRPQKLTDTDKRRTRATALDDLPPQLRASAFFDLPSNMPTIAVKGGSAMATLDSILDASAKAPVSAFTDHAFAGKLGAEVYGTEKKKKKKAKKDRVADEHEAETDHRKTIIARNSSTDLLDGPKKPNKLKKRASQLSLLGVNAQQDDDLEIAEGRTTLGLVGGEDGARRTSRGNRDGSSTDNDENAISPNQLAPDSDENPDDEDEGSTDSDDDDDVYRGPPTTLLAELQLRKQQNKLRTQPKLGPNGLHTTLLELDAVAEVERKARKGKRINLAWEDPSANPDHLEDQDDDDVPLGMLFVAKAAGNTPANMDISAVMNEVNRPLGLMERRELEDNEPLSQRRDRLQGRDGGLMPTSLGMMQKRMTQLSLAPGQNGLGLGGLGTRSMSRLALPLQAPPSMMGGSAPGSVSGGNPDEGEAESEGETLAQRKARLAAENPLPRARPVSGMFSSELLSQFGGTEAEDLGKDDDSKGKGKDVPEEEETLGQRRKRLQAERDARAREMNAGGGLSGGFPGAASTMNLNRNTMISNIGTETPANRLSHRLSMSDMLAAHPIDTPQGMLDPRTQDRLRREAEAERVEREKNAKMAAMRAQMPTSMDRVSVGARNGGYMGGRFNDGSAGLGLGPQQQQQQQQGRMSSIGIANPMMKGVGGMGVGSGYNGYGTNNMAAGYAAPGQQYGRASTLGNYGAGVGMNYAGGGAGGYGAPAAAVGGVSPYGGGRIPMQMQMPMLQQPVGGGMMPGQQGQPVDMVERWRQSVMP